MKYLITIPASITRGKNPKLVPAQFKITEAFNIDQAKRRAHIVDNKAAMTVEPLDEWIAKIDTI